MEVRDIVQETGIKTIPMEVMTHLVLFGQNLGLEECEPHQVYIVNKTLSPSCSGTCSLGLL